MHIVNALFTRTSGGLEQAYADSVEALASQGHKVTALLRPDAPYQEAVRPFANVAYAAPTGFYDIATAWRIRCLLARLKPDIIIAHNARAIALLHLASYGMGIALCGVSHSYKTARTTRADHLIVITEHMRGHFIKSGHPAEHITVIPNLIHLPLKPAARPRHKPIVIGAMGRFTIEKGFAELMKALHLLKQQGVEFVARIAGDGEEKEALQRLAQTLDLTERIRWEGWLQDKTGFYNSVDMVCVPSLSETFGLVVLEALAHGVPVVATDTPGPASILAHGVNGLIVPRDNPAALAAALTQLIAQPALASRLAEAGWQRVQDFSFESVAKQWDACLSTISV